MLTIENMKSTNKHKEKRSIKHTQSQLIKIIALSVGAFLFGAFFWVRVAMDLCVGLYSDFST